MPRSCSRPATIRRGSCRSLHDFGARGVSSLESAALGGAAHLVNFLGTDTVSALCLARAHYHAPMAGYSIPAAEHSTITSWGREREVDAYRNMLRQFGKPGAIVAVVSDSYDIYRAISEHWGTTLRDAVIASGATLVIRPDSGDPVEVVAESLRRLDEAFGHVINGKGYRVLNHVRVIQGDGINPDTIRAILQRITGDGYAADNVAFGMGGALLQRLDRDTQKFALKCSAARVDGEWVDVYRIRSPMPARPASVAACACCAAWMTVACIRCHCRPTATTPCRSASRTRW